MSFPYQVVQTFPENWPDALIELAPPALSFELSPQDARVLASHSRLFRTELGDFRAEGLTGGFYDAITKALETFPGGIMPRIGYCSWKASMPVNHPLRRLNEVMQVITADDPRIGYGMMVAHVSSEPVTLHLRQWIAIEPWREFRVFIQRGNPVGISQYFWQDTFAQIAMQPAAISSAIMAFLAEIRGELHLPDIVLDLALLPEAEGFRPLLIELNPMSNQTDACLFSWHGGGDFDGGFRYNEPQHQRSA